MGSTDLASRIAVAGSEELLSMIARAGVKPAVLIETYEESDYTLMDALETSKLNWAGRPDIPPQVTDMLNRLNDNVGRITSGPYQYEEMWELLKSFDRGEVPDLKVVEPATVFEALLEIMRGVRPAVKQSGLLDCKCPDEKEAESLSRALADLPEVIRKTLAALVRIVAKDIASADLRQRMYAVRALRSMLPVDLPRPRDCLEEKGFRVTEALLRNCEVVFRD
jgi:hypothetical protein